MHFAAFTAAGEAQRLAEAAGIDLADLGRVVRHTDQLTGGPGAIMHRATTAAVARDDGWFEVLDHVRALGEKDLEHAITLADRLGVEVTWPTTSSPTSGAGRGWTPPSGACC